MVPTDRIVVYVRKGEEKHLRLLSFIPPSEFTQADLIEAGWGLDGNQAIRSINIGLLHQTEIKIAESFRQRGYETHFS